MIRPALLRVLCALPLLSAARAGAEGVQLKHVASIYADEESRAFKAPEGVACRPDGPFVVADTGNGRFVSYGLREGVPEGGKPWKVDGVSYPRRIQFDGDGKLLVLDGRTKRLARVSEPGKLEGWVEVPGARAGAVVAAFTVDAAKNVYVLEVAGGTVSVLAPDGTVTRTIPAPPGAAFRDLAVDASGTLYALDALGRSVWACTATAKAFTPFTKSLKDVMSFPAWLTVTKGRIYVVDENGSGVLILGQDGGVIGRRLAFGWTEGLVRYPAQLCIDEAGDAILADRQNQRVQVFSMR